MRSKRKYFPSGELEEFDELYRRLDSAYSQIDDLQSQMDRRQIPGWWIEPDLLNGVAQPSPTVAEPFAYRIYTGNLPEFKGHLDISGASSPVHAFTVTIGPNDVILPHNVYRPQVVFSGSTAQMALVGIDATSGHVTITWPVT